MVQLNGKVAIVTGGAKGIGKAITVALAEEGAKVVINYNSSKEAAENLVNELGKEGHDVYAVQADVSKVEDANRLVEEAVNHFGQVDILVNNAGITRDRTFKKLNREDWERVIDVNLSSVFNTTMRYFHTYRKQKKEESLVFLLLLAKLVDLDKQTTQQQKQVC